LGSGLGHVASYWNVGIFSVFSDRALLSVWDALSNLDLGVAIARRRIGAHMATAR
jgi:hypothetical protein